MRAFHPFPSSRLGAILVALLLITLTTACQQEATPVPTPMEVDPQAEEESVYASLFAEIYGEPRMYVLMEQSSPGMGGVEALDSILDTYLTRFSDLEAETAESFRLRNETATSLPANMDIGLPYVLLTQADFQEIFALNTSGWDVFYTRYPNSPGMTTLSRVGFNDDFTQAFLYAGTWSNWLAGAGFYYLLEKVDGAWVILQQVMAWIS